MQEKAKKKAGTSSAVQFLDRFPDEASARSFVERSIWGGKPTCPKCRSRRHGLWTAREELCRCKDCRKIHSVRIGAVFENGPWPCAPPALCHLLDANRSQGHLVATAGTGTGDHEEIGLVHAPSHPSLGRERDAQGVGRGGDGSDVNRRQGNRRPFREEAGNRSGELWKAGCSWCEGLRDREN